jgi:hypothetical protein
VVTSKILPRYKGSTISIQAVVHMGHMPRALMTKKKKKGYEMTTGIISDEAGKRNLLIFQR